MKEGFKILIMMDIIAFVIGLIIGGTWWLWGLLMGLITALLFKLRSKASIVPILIGCISCPVLYWAAAGLVVVNVLANAYFCENQEVRA